MHYKEFIQLAGLTMEFEQADRNPNMADMLPGSFHWKVTLASRTKDDGKDEPPRTMALHYSKGPGHKDSPEPTLEEVLGCLASDAGSVANTSTFEEWASDLGYNTDSQEAEKTYKACKKQADDLADLLGNDLYETLLQDVNDEDEDEEPPEPEDPMAIRDAFDTDRPDLTSYLPAPGDGDDTD